MATLVVTNGRSGVDSIRAAGVEGEIFSWDDVLHDGPVPGGYELPVLSELRARYLASVDEMSFDKIKTAFEARDAQLLGARSFDELVLFFEHDLYDQLQLLQVLFLLHTDVSYSGHIAMAEPPTYIGYCKPEALMEAFGTRSQVDAACIDAGVKYWEAFTAETPDKLGEMLRYETPLLPHMQPALLRLAESYPNVDTGLSRTEQQILTILADGPENAGILFRKNQEMEVAMFLGDASFMQRLSLLCSGNNPLVQVVSNGMGAPSGASLVYPHILKQSFQITAAGRSVLSGEMQRTNFIPVDRWIGGVHLSAAQVWYWHPEEFRFVG
ncbi:MAG: hypothetical protein AAF564_26330 [Bacteroidota bacterium]